MNKNRPSKKSLQLYLIIMSVLCPSLQMYIMYMYISYLHIRVIGPLPMLQGSTISTFVSKVDMKPLKAERPSRPPPHNWKKANKTVIPFIISFYVYYHTTVHSSYRYDRILVVAGHVPVLSIFSYQEKPVLLLLLSLLGKAGITSKLL